MFSLTTVFTIICVHFFADFFMQTDWQAQNKSTNIIALLSHTCIYSFVWIFGAMVLFPKVDQEFLLLLFVLITFVTHTIIDFFTSKLNKRLWNEKKVHWFFVSVGFDQVLHYIQLFLTYYLLTI